MIWKGGSSTSIKSSANPGIGSDIDTLVGASIRAIVAVGQSMTVGVNLVTTP